MEIMIVKQIVSNHDYRFSKKRGPLICIYPYKKFLKRTSTNQNLDLSKLIRSVLVRWFGFFPKTKKNPYQPMLQKSKLRIEKRGMDQAVSYSTPLFTRMVMKKSVICPVKMSNLHVLLVTVQHWSLAKTV